MMHDLYAFVYRGILTEESLDKVGRQRRRHFGPTDAVALRRTLSYDVLDPDLMATSQRMAVVYTALHAFENTVRQFVMKAMAEHYGEEWWNKVPEKIRKRVMSRMNEDSKFRWHGARGASDINYCDFGDLASIIVTNWEVFQDVLSNLEWAKAILNTLEKSRNIVMHGGTIANEDTERIGMNIRDWVRQTG